MGRLRKVLDVVGLVTEYITGGLMAVLTIVVFSGVFSRYVLRDPWQWTEEMSRAIFIWMVFLGASVAVRRRLHFKFTLLAEAFGQKWRTWFMFISSLWVLFFSVIMLWRGFEYTSINVAQSTASLGISMAWVTAAVPIGALLMTLYSLYEVLEFLFESVTNTKRGIGA